jgi:hypothetical protein
MFAVKELIDTASKMLQVSFTRELFLSAIIIFPSPKTEPSPGEIQGFTF